MSPALAMASSVSIVEQSYHKTARGVSPRKRRFIVQSDALPQSACSQRRLKRPASSQSIRRTMLVSSSVSLNRGRTRGALFAKKTSCDQPQFQSILVWEATTPALISARCDLIEQSVYKGRRIGITELFCDLDGFVDDRGFRCVVAPKQFVRRHTQKTAIDLLHPR